MIINIFKKSTVDKTTVKRVEGDEESIVSD